MTKSPDVVIVGAGVMGCATAYYLSKEGYRVVVLEKESVASGASGVSAAMLGTAASGKKPLPPRPVADLGISSFRLHQELAKILPEESSVDIGYRENISISPAFTDEDAAMFKSQTEKSGGQLQWIENNSLRKLEPRLNSKALGALISPQAQVVASRFVLALAKAGERVGMEIHHCEAVGLKIQGQRVSGVQIDGEDSISAKHIVLAMGPWSQQITTWIGLKIPIYPVRGQILQLRVPDPQIKGSISYGGMYVVSKADGTTLAGTTEEHESGFVNLPTPEGRKVIMEGILRLAPSLNEAEVLNHVSGLRPGSGDGLPLIGPVPGWDGLYIVSGHFRTGMNLSLMSAKIISNLIARGSSPPYAKAFDPGRFGPA